MTKASGKAGKKATDKATDKDAQNAPQLADASSETIGDAAPLEPPADEAADPAEGDSQDPAQGDTGQADGQDTGDAATDAEGQDAGQGEAPAGDGQVDPGGSDDGQGSQDGAGDDDTKPPATATLDPPAPKPDDDEKPQLPGGLTDAAADRLKTAHGSLSITDQHGDPVDPDDVFTEVQSNGMRRCKIRLLKHTVQPPFDRKFTTLLLAKGAYISEAGARTILARIQAERA